MRLRFALTTTAALAIGLLSACSSGDTGPKVASVSEPPSQSKQAGKGGKDDGTDIDALREFAKCMREHGVDMPDPKESDGGVIALPSLPEGEAASEEARKANEACKSLLPNGGEPQKPSPEELDEQREFAQCMREHGVDVPDPDPNSQSAPGIPMNEDTEAAIKACSGEEPPK